MVHKSHIHKRASVSVVIVAQVVVQVFAVRHLVAVASRRACSSRLAAAEMGMTVASLIFWPTVTQWDAAAVSAPLPKTQ
jgi:hypothetical protein